MSDFLYAKDADGIVTVAMDMQGQQVNSMNEAFLKLLKQVISQLASETNFTGVILTSAKSTFFAGGDIKHMLNAEKESLAYWRDLNMQIKAQLRILENMNVPVVAAINGAALGGGYEICLCCHYRISLNHDRALIGLPEVTLGLMPGGGGIVRLVRLLGLAKALPILLEGAMYRPAQALEMGLINDIASDPADMHEKARLWIKSNPSFVQPWNQSTFAIPGGTQKSNNTLAALLQNYPAVLSRKYDGYVPPACRSIVAAAAESLQVDLEGALTIETRYFLSLLATPEAKKAMTAFLNKRK